PNAPMAVKWLAPSPWRRAKPVRPSITSSPLSKTSANVFAPWACSSISFMATSDPCRSKPAAGRPPAGWGGARRRKRPEPGAAPGAPLLGQQRGQIGREPAEVRRPVAGADHADGVDQHGDAVVGHPAVGAGHRDAVPAGDHGDLGGAAGEE